MEHYHKVSVSTVLLAVVFLFVDYGHSTGLDKPRKITGVRFLLTVNDTWMDPPGCIATIATPFIQPDVPYNKSQHLMVGDCDHGPLQFTVQSPGQNNNTYTVSLIFHSSVIEDASPPTCVLSWNGTYLVPQKENMPSANLLPSCFTMESRGGYHMTAYWFNILEWRFA